MRLKIENIEPSNYYKMPKKIYEYDLKPIHRELYMLCLENWRLSIKNNWVNSNGEIYFYATHEMIMDLMNVGKDAVISAFKKLVELGLLQVEKDKGKANIYYLTDLSTPVEKTDHYQSENQSTPVEKTEYPYSEKPSTVVGKTDTRKNNTTRRNKERINKKEYIFVNWNNLADELGLSKLVKWTDNRKRKFNNLSKKYSEEEIMEALEKIRESDFLQGKKSNWKMTFDDFIEERKFVKLLEDGYKDKNRKISSDIKINKSGKKEIDLTEDDVKNTLESWGM